MRFQCETKGTTREVGECPAGDICPECQRRRPENAELGEKTCNFHVLHANAEDSMQKPFELSSYH